MASTSTPTSSASAAAAGPSSTTPTAAAPATPPGSPSSCSSTSAPAARTPRRGAGSPCSTPPAKLVPSYSRASNGIHRFTRKGAAPWGCDRFIRRAALEQSYYLRDDCFSVRCDITVYKDIRKEDGAAGRFVFVPPSDMHRHLARLLEAGEGADVAFEVAGETVAAHRCVLAARSPVFMAELFGPMKEKTSARVRIHDMEARVFKALLHFVYTDSLPADIEDADKVVMAQHLLVAADRYSLDRLKLMCEDKLCGYIDTRNVGTILALAEQHDCQGLKKACFKFLMSGSNLKAAIPTNGFQHLTDSCPSVLRELLAKAAILIYSS